MLLYYLTQYFTLNLTLKLKIDLKKCTFKNLKEILKPGKNLPKPVATLVKIKL